MSYIAPGIYPKWASICAPSNQFVGKKMSIMWMMCNGGEVFFFFFFKETTFKTFFLGWRELPHTTQQRDTGMNIYVYFLPINGNPRQQLILNSSALQWRHLSTTDVPPKTFVRRNKWHGQEKNCCGLWRSVTPAFRCGCKKSPTTAPPRVLYIQQACRKIYISYQGSM